MVDMPSIIFKGVLLALPALWPFIAFILAFAAIKFLYSWYEKRRLGRS